MNNPTKAKIAAALRSAAAQLSADWPSAEVDEWSKAIVHLRQALGAVKNAEKAGDMDYSGIKEKIVDIMDLMDQFTEADQSDWEDSN
jgi:hypothetical protein